MTHDDDSVLTAQCADGHCPDCPDVDANCCECSCHLDLGEPDHNDEVKCCPDCERPNQFGELCDSCRRDQNTEYEAQRHPVWDESACMGSMD